MAVTSFGAVRGGLLASLRQKKATETANDPDNSKNVMSRFRPPFHYTDGLGGVAAVDASVAQVLIDGDGNAFQINPEGTFSGSAPQIAVNARGALLKTDGSAAAKGLAIDLGYGESASEIPNCRGAFIVGTDEPFYLRVRLDIADVSDADQVAVGFVVGGRPVDGLLDTYGNYAVLNMDNGTVNIETRLNSGTASVTATGSSMIDFDSTGSVVDLEVRVSKGGAVNFLINGAEPSTDVTGFTFDDADTVNATFLFLNDLIGGDPTITLHEWESGYLSARGPDSIFDLGD